jgi:hypothetical protein
MGSASTFILEHLEQVSTKAFDVRRTELEEVLGRKPGIYALYFKSRLTYVGRAKCLYRRINQHRRDRHGGRWDRFSAYVTRRADLSHEVEAIALRIMMPSANRKGGRLRRSTNLTRELESLLEVRLREEKAELLGGRRGVHHRRRVARGRKGKAALAALVGQRRQLRGEYRGKEVRAMLLKDGTIRIGAEHFDSPSAALRHVAGRGVGAWKFWKLRDPRRGWVSLSEFK